MSLAGVFFCVTVQLMSIITLKGYMSNSIPLYFELSADRECASSLIKSIRKFVQSSDVLEVSEPLFFSGKDCLPHDGDIHSSFKIRSRIIRIYQNEFESISPDEIHGLEIKLSNEEMFYLGFAYLNSGNEVQWAAQVNTMKLSYGRTHECAISHKSVVDILDYARDIGVEVQVVDPLRYWENRDFHHLEDECRHISA